MNLSSSSSNNRVYRRRASKQIARATICTGCAQYREDCSCCVLCGGADVHTFACELHQAAAPDTIRSPNCWIVDPDANELGTTEEAPRPTLHSRR